MAFVPIVVFVFWIGLYPKPFLQVTDASLNHLIETIETNARKADSYTKISADVDERLADLTQIESLEIDRKIR